MNRLSSKIFILCGLCSFLISTAAAQDVLDGIAATVDDRIILISEVESQLQLILAGTENQEIDPQQLDSLRHELLNQMIDDKLILIEAEKDTTIQVTSEEVESALNKHIERIKSQFPSEEIFLSQLTAEGLTLRELRSRYRDEVKNQLIKEAFLNKALTKVSVSSGEVKEFYDAYVDSLPKRPAAIHLAHILIAAVPSQETKDSLYAFAQVLVNKIKQGEKFELLAKSYSDDASAIEGGDLGWFTKGDMVTEFEDAAYALSIGEVSGIVETKYGYHIIKCTEKNEQRIRASHILLRFIPTDEDLEKSKAKADSLYQVLLAGVSFDTLAMENSDDETSVSKGGDLDWYASNELTPEFKEAVVNLEPGQFSTPVLSQFGYHILKVLEKKDSRALDFKEDYQDIEAIAKRFKAQKDLSTWLDGARQTYYIEVKI